jgi:zinc/manganese transport system substrate-binding protein
MRRRARPVALLVALFPALAAIASARADSLKVVATTSVLGDLVETVAGDKAMVVTLVGPDADVHTYLRN